MESVGSIILYVIVALVMIICSVLAVTTRKILRAATYLLFTLFAAAVVYFMLDYQFLGAVQIAVYAGGIVVLFVFAILLTSHPGNNSAVLASKRRFSALVAALGMFLLTGSTLMARLNLFAPKDAAYGNPSMKTIGEAMMGSGYDQYLLPFEAVSVLLLACIIGGIVVARKR